MNPTNLNILTRKLYEIKNEDYVVEKVIINEVEIKFIGRWSFNPESFTLSFDHIIADGIPVSRVIEMIKQYITDYVRRASPSPYTARTWPTGTSTTSTASGTSGYTYG